MKSMPHKPFSYNKTQGQHLVTAGPSVFVSETAVSAILWKENRWHRERLKRLPEWVSCSTPLWHSLTDGMLIQGYKLPLSRDIY